MESNTRDELTKELAEVRRRGIKGIESPNPRHRRLELPILRQAIDDRYKGLPLPFVELVSTLLVDVVGNVEDDVDRETLWILFDFIELLPLNHHAVGKVAEQGRTPDKLRVVAREFYSDEHSPPEGEQKEPVRDPDWFRKGPELNLLSQLADKILASQPQRVSKPSPLPDDLLIERSTFHVMRTLEARKEHLHPLALEVLDDVLNRFRDWHLAGTGDTQQLITELGWLCERYVGKSLYDLVGTIRINARQPECPPHMPIPWCTYPNDNSLEFIPGGTDPFTGRHVDPFYIAVAPVTAYEWLDFSRKFNWQLLDSWLSIFGRFDPAGHKTTWGKLPAIGMTFYDCLTYCFWLWGTTPYRFRLPTESEWNFAATGGERLQYPWGDAPSNERGWYSTTPRNPGVPCPVDFGSPTGPYELWHFSGNVWEYTSTLWRGDDAGSGSDLLVPDLPFSLGYSGWWEADSRLPDEFPRPDWREAVKFVMKGGSWGGGPEYGTVESRIYSSFYNSGVYGGFRLAISAMQNPQTGEYYFEPSPFIKHNLQQVRLVSGTDFLAPEERGLTLTGCGGNISPTDFSVTEAVSWDVTTHQRQQG